MLDGIDPFKTEFGRLRAGMSLRERVSNAWKEVAEANGASRKEIEKFSDSFEVLAAQARTHLGLAQRATSTE